MKRLMGPLTLSAHDGRAFWQATIEFTSQEPASVLIAHRLDAETGRFVQSEVREMFPQRAQRGDTYTIDAEPVTSTRH